MLMVQKEQEWPAGYKRSYDLVIFLKSIGGFRNSQGPEILHFSWVGFAGRLSPCGLLGFLFVWFVFFIPPTPLYYVHYGNRAWQVLYHWATSIANLTSAPWEFRWGWRPSSFLWHHSLESCIHQLGIRRPPATSGMFIKGERMKPWLWLFIIYQIPSPMPETANRDPKHPI